MSVGPERLGRWIDGFAARHGPLETTAGDEVVRLAAHFGGQAPVNARLCALVHDAERAAARPAWRGDALWAELTAQAPHTGNVRAA